MTKWDIGGCKNTSEAIDALCERYNVKTADDLKAAVYKLFDKRAGEDFTPSDMFHLKQLFNAGKFNLGDLTAREILLFNSEEEEHAVLDYERRKKLLHEVILCLRFDKKDFSELNRLEQLDMGKDKEASLCRQFGKTCWDELNVVEQLCVLRCVEFNKDRYEDLQFYEQEGFRSEDAYWQDFNSTPYSI